MRTLAMDLTRLAQQKDTRSEACLCLLYCRDQIRYVKDIRTAEVIQTPEATLRLGAGDCDDKSVLLSALLGSIGHRTRYIAIAQIPGQYSHVWVQDYVNGKWLDLEATEPLSCGERVPEAGVHSYLLQDV